MSHRRDPKTTTTTTSSGTRSGGTSYTTGRDYKSGASSSGTTSTYTRGGTTSTSTTSTYTRGATSSSGTSSTYTRSGAASGSPSASAASKYTPSASSSYTSKYTSSAASGSTYTSKYSSNPSGGSLRPDRPAERERKTSTNARTDRDRLSNLTSAYKPDSKYSKDPNPPSSAAVARVANSSAATKTSASYYKPLYPAAPSAAPGAAKKQHDEHAAVIFDHGSKVFKAGVAGEVLPRFVCPSVMGKPRHPGLLAGMTKKDFYVGDEAQQKRDALALSWPMENGLITNFDDANKIWRFAFKEIETLPDDQPLIWTEAALINQQQREKVAEIFYEEHGVPAIHFGLQSVLSVYSAGITTALVVDLGDKCDVMPVYEGGSFSHPYEQAIKRLKTTGSDITEHLEQILAERGYHFTTPAEREIVNYLKEQTTYVSLTPDSEITQETSLLLPDGQTITIGNERYRAPEVLFAPALAGKEGMGLHALVYHSIMESGIDMRVELARSILLIGGTSMIPGLAPRIEKELSLLAPSQKWEINVIVPNDRKYAAWIGGTILASIDSFEKLCIAKEMWTEIGPSVLHDQHTW